MKGRLAAFAAALAGSAVLGVAAGLIWATVAPRALLQEVGHGEAQLVNAESTAYILADAWFCLIAAIGGVITGIAGYRLLVRRSGWREYFDPFSGAGYGSADFSWSAALTIDLLRSMDD